MAGDGDGDNDYSWTAEDYKRLSATSPEQFARFDAMLSFDLRRLNNPLKFVGKSHMKTRMEYALSVSKSIRYVVPEMEREGGECESESEKKKMEGGECESESEKKKMEGGECESEPEKKKMKMNNDKWPSNKNKLYGDLSPSDVFKYYAEKVVYKIIDPKDPMVQARVANIRKLVAERSKSWCEIYDKEGPAAAEAEAKAKAKGKAPLLV